MASVLIVLAAITKYHRVGGLLEEISHSLEALKFEIRAPDFVL